MVLVRRVDTEAIALQREGELGLWASLLGEEAARMALGGAMPRTWRSRRTGARRRLVRGLDPLRLIFRGVSNGAGTQGAQVPPGTPIGDRRPDAARHRLRHGHPRTREGDEAVIVYFGDGATQPGDVSEAFAWASVFNAPVVVLLPRTTSAVSSRSDRSRVRVTSAPAASASPASGWTATTCSVRGHGSRRRRPRGGGPPDRGLSTGMGVQMMMRRPDACTGGQRREEYAATAGPDRAGPRLTWPAPARPTRPSSRGQRGGRRLGAAHQGRLPGACRSGSPAVVRLRLRRPQRDPRRRARALRGEPGELRRARRRDGAANRGRDGVRGGRR